MKVAGTIGVGHRVLIGVTAVDSIAVGVILPAMPFIVFGLHIGAFGLGALIAAASIAGLVGAPIWGALADRYGSRRLLLVAPLVAAAGHVLFAFSTNYPMLLTARIIVGFGSAVVLLAQTHALLTVGDLDRTATLGRVTAAQGFGNIIGPALGGLLLSFGTVAVGLTAAAGPLVAWLLTLLLLRDAGPSAAPANRQRRFASAGAVLRSAHSRRLAVVIFIGWLCFAGYAAMLPVELADRLHIGSTFYGYTVAISGAVALLVRGLLLGRLVNAFGEIHLMTIGAVSLGVSMLMAPLIPTVWLVPLLPLTWAVGASLLFPATVAELSRLVRAGSVGLAMGAAAMLSGIGIVLGPLAAGVVNQYLWSQGPFYIGVVLMALVAVLVSRKPPVPVQAVP